MIDCTAWVFVVGYGETPAAVVFGVGFHDAHGEELLEAFELAGDHDAMSEWTEETHVEVIAVGLDGELVGAKLMAPGALGGWVVALSHGGRSGEVEDFGKRGLRRSFRQ